MNFETMLGDGIVRFTREHSDIKLPEIKSLWAAGADLRSNEDQVVKPGAVVGIKTGLRMQLPSRFLAALITPRSGLALNADITVGNSPGLLDPDYRGELIVILKNHSANAFYVRKGDRIAQLQIVPNFLQCVKMTFVDVLSDTERGESGLGSTGV